MPVRLVFRCPFSALELDPEVEHIPTGQAQALGFRADVDAGPGDWFVCPDRSPATAEPNPAWVPGRI